MKIIYNRFNNQSSQLWYNLAMRFSTNFIVDTHKDNSVIHPSIMWASKKWSFKPYSKLFSHIINET
jgi:hypothetical protein